MSSYVHPLFQPFYSFRTALFLQWSSTNASAWAATSSKVQSRTRESAQIRTDRQTQAGRRRDRLENRQTPVFLSSTKEEISLFSLRKMTIMFKICNFWIILEIKNGRRRRNRRRRGVWQPQVVTGKESRDTVTEWQSEIQSEILRDHIQERYLEILRETSTFHTV